MEDIVIEKSRFKIGCAAAASNYYVNGADYC